MILHELQMTGDSHVEIRAGNLRADAHRQRAGIISRIGNTDSSLTAIGSERQPALSMERGLYFGPTDPRKSCGSGGSCGAIALTRDKHPLSFLQVVAEDVSNGHNGGGDSF